MCRGCEDGVGLMKRRIEKVAVLGAGTMGARIAAHLANAGIPCYLLDIVPPELNAEEKRKGLTLENPAVRNRIVLAGLEAAKKSRPGGFFHAADCAAGDSRKFRRQPRRGAARWIGSSRPSPKNSKSSASFSSASKRCASRGRSSRRTLPACRFTLIAEGRSEDFQQHWAGTHFFNPPRYMKLVELIAGPKTRPEVLESLDEICDLRLGKGVVVAKDTPNFIANRIGTFSMLNVAAQDASAGDDHRGSGRVHRAGDRAGRSRRRFARRILSGSMCWSTWCGIFTRTCRTTNRARCTACRRWSRK